MTMATFKTITALLPLVLNLVSVSAAPVQSANPHIVVANKLLKRAEPQIPDGQFSEADADRVDGSFDFVQQHVNYVLTGTDARVLPIFRKYFNEADKDAVFKVFNTICNGDPNGGTNPLLDDIFVQADDPSNLCGAGTRTTSYILGWEGDSPVIHFCGAGLAHKIRDETTCDYLGDYASYKLNTIGAILLHEYTHFNKMIGPAGVGEIIDYDDEGYGIVATRNIDKTKALTNADSYSFFAAEVVWSTLCQRDFLDPRPGIDDADPSCNNAACQAPQPPA